jgi:aspartate kinase
MNKVLVMKFGGAALATPEQFSQAAELIIARKEDFQSIVVVVSAMGSTTDQLIQLAKEIHPNPPQREYDMLVSVGERISMSLLAMALCLKQQEAVSFTGSQAGIITTACHSDAEIVDVRPWRLLPHLQQGRVVIVAGFQGVSSDREITTLGRGGSDTTAVALALALGADKVEFYKDVPGFFDKDPKKHQDAHCYPHISYGEALEIINRGARILHARAVRLASNNGLPLHIRSFVHSLINHSGTCIGSENAERKGVPIFEQCAQ